MPNYLQISRVIFNNHPFEKFLYIQIGKLALSLDENILISLGREP